MVLTTNLCNGLKCVLHVCMDRVYMLNKFLTYSDGTSILLIDIV